MPDTEFIPAAYANLPMPALIGAPLKAASDANLDLAAGMLDYVNKLGFKSTTTIATPSTPAVTTVSPRLLEFDIQRPLQAGGVSTPVHVQAPLLSLVPIPALLVENVDIDFQMEVNLVTKETSAVNVEVGAEFNSSRWWGDVKIYGKVTASRENTRSTSQSAKYQVRVVARQQPMSEGMGALVSLLANIMDPLPAAPTTQGTPAKTTT